MGTATKTLCSDEISRRNGAQPYRLGMVEHCQTVPFPADAAMEPSLIGWEWEPDGGEPAENPQAAMEPSLIGWEWQRFGKSGVVAV